jgi:hypothetical protein
MTSFSAVLDCDFFQSDPTDINGESVLERDLDAFGLADAHKK